MTYRTTLTFSNSAIGVISSPLSSSGLAIVNAARMQEMLRNKEAWAKCNPEIRRGH
jgi:hypothetical protein